MSDSNDPVERAIEQWSRERPDLEGLDAMAIFARLSRLAALARPAVEAGIARYGLKPGEFDVLACLRRTGEPFELTPKALVEHLLLSSGAMTNRLDRLEAAGGAAETVRRDRYFEARRLLRQIAFCNPRLDFDRILFIKRCDPGGLYHMVHQYYGFGAVAGGGLFVLSNPFSDEPEVTNLLETAVVEKGRLAGRRLEPRFRAPAITRDRRPGHDRRPLASPR